MNRVLVNGLMIYGFRNRLELMNLIEKDKKCLIAINAEKILNATEESHLLINQNIGYADGVGAVWALKKKGLKKAIKIPGCELWLDIVEHFYQSKSIYLVGATEEVLQTTIDRLKLTYPEINIVGARNGYIKNEKEKNVLLQSIESLKPDIVFVAMGSPRQELLIREMQKRHIAIYQGLGGSFDVFVGKVQRAPQWWISKHLEWAYRLLRQPFRIRRQLRLFLFLYRLFFNKY